MRKFFYFLFVFVVTINFNVKATKYHLFNITSLNNANKNIVENCFFAPPNGTPTNYRPSDRTADVLVSARTLTWGAVANATGYRITIGTTSGASDIANNVLISTNSYTFGSSWNYSSTYFWTVTAIFSNGTTQGTESCFYTQCGPATPPYRQDFKYFKPGCWLRAEGQLKTHTSLAHGKYYHWSGKNFGNNATKGKSMGVSVYSAGEHYWEITPSFNLSSGNHILEFDVALTQSTLTPSITLGSDDSLAVVISTDNGATWSKSNILYCWTSATKVNNTGNHIIIDLSAYSSIVKIGFYASSSVSNVAWDFFIDNFYLHSKPSCPAPFMLTSSSETSSGAKLNWQSINGSYWDVYITTSGGAAPTQSTSPTINDISSKTTIWSGGNNNTTYEWYVRTDCGHNNSNTSSWRGPQKFSTLPPAHSFPLTEGFESGLTYFTNASSNGAIFADSITLHHGGSHCVKNTYSNNQSNKLIETGILDLSSKPNAILEFWHIAKTEGNYDRCFIEISTNGGQNYYTLPPSTYQGNSRDYSSKWYFHEDSYSQWGTGNQTPTNTWWKKEVFVLEDYAKPNVRIRFRLYSDGSVIRKGWYIDDIHIYEPSCAKPSNQQETSITTTGATLGWTGTQGSYWDVYIATRGSSRPIQTTIPTINDKSSTSAIWSSGQAGNTYDWYVRRDCGQNNSNTSYWEGPASFSTLCTTRSTPWTDNVESHSTTVKSEVAHCWRSKPKYTASKYRWDIDGGGSTPTSNTGPSGAHGGSRYFYTEASDGKEGDVAELYTPSISLNGLTHPLLEFYSHLYGSNIGSLHVDLYDGSNWHNDIMPVISGQQQTSPSSAWCKQTVNLGAYSGTIQIRFRGIRGNGLYGDISIDDISIKEASSCGIPTSLRVEEKTFYSAKLRWTENGIASSWNIEYGVHGFSKGSGTFISVSSNPYTLSGLNANTSYDWYVQSVCGSGTSSWSSSNTFSTTDGKPKNPGPPNEEEDVLPSARTLIWDDISGATGYHISIGTTAGGTDLVNNASISNNSYTYGSNWKNSSTYFWKVTSNASGTSVVGDDWYFTSTCGSVSPTYLQDFAIRYWGCWSKAKGTLKTHTKLYDNFSFWSRGDFKNVASQGKSAAFNISGVITGWLFSPTINLSGGSYQLEFDIALTEPYNTNQTTLNSDDTIALVISTDNGISWSKAKILKQWTSDTYLSAAGGHKTVYLSSYSGKVKFGFYASSTVSNSGKHFFIDNFLIKSIPSCKAPTNQTETNITSTSATLGWTKHGNESQWPIEYGPQGFNQGSGTTITVTSNPYTLSNLTTNTKYEWYVRASCGSGSYSSWTGRGYFKPGQKITSTHVPIKLNKCSPYYQRLNESGNSTSYISFYDEIPFMVAQTGKYDIIAEWTGFDGYLHLYNSSFDPSSPSTNWMAGNDDDGTTNKSKITNQTLNSGTLYYIICTSFNSYTNGTGSAWISGVNTSYVGATSTYHGKPNHNYTIPATDGTTRIADYECDDDNGWTTYFDDNGTTNNYADDNLLLSIKKNSNNFGSTTVKVAGAAGVSYIAPSSSFSQYVNSFNGWYVFNRYWVLTPTTQPSSDVGVRFYYNTADFTALNSALTSAGRNSLANHNKMSFIKINDLTNSGYNPNPANGHNNIPKATAYNADGAWIYSNAGAASTNRWLAGTYGSGFFAEFTVAHFSGGGGGAAGNSKDGSLPISLINFNAFANGDINKVVWKTATELNVDHFIIERMNPNGSIIENIGEVDAAGNSNTIQSYSFDDIKPLDEAYYRIKNVDIDGASETFNWLYVKRANNLLNIVELYPNPAKNNTNIEIINPINNSIHIEIHDVVGQLILTKDYSLGRGLNSVNIDLTSISSGTYYLSVDNTVSKTVKVLIVD